MSKETPEVRCLLQAERNGGVISRNQARQLGLTDKMVGRLLSSGRWEQPFPGALWPAGTPHAWEGRLRAAVVAAGDTAAASHRSAAKLWGFEGLESEDVIEITTSRRIRWSGVVIHRAETSQRETTRVRGIRSSTATQVLLELGSVVPPSRLEAALDSALIQGLTSIPYLGRKLAENGGRGKRGVGPLKELLRARVDHAPRQSELERMFMKRVVRRHRLEVPAVQFPVTDGERKMAIDFAYPDRLVGIELLGWRFHSGRTKWERDLARHNRLAARDWLVLYFSWSDVMQRPEWVAARIRDALRGRNALSLDA